jgi:hypothetical protein
MSEKVFIGIDKERFELTGKDLDNFKAEQAKRKEIQEAFKKDEEAKKATRLSALSKLAALGLTEEEIAAL